MNLEQTDSTDLFIKQTKRNNKIILIAIISFLLVTSLHYLYDRASSIFFKQVDIYDVEMISMSELCPGDDLIFRYRFKTEGKGVLVKDFTLWRQSPPKTMVFSEARRFIVKEVDQQLVETWPIPERYFSYETWSDEPLEPGNYLRYFAVTSSVQDVTFDIEEIPFTIKPKEECVT